MKAGVCPDVHPFAAEVFAALDANGIEWCVLRDEAKLAQPAGDVDILVSKSGALGVSKALAPLGFVRLPAWGHASHRFFLTYEHASDLFVKLDFTTELSYGPFQTLRTGAESSCFARRRRVGPLALPSVDDYFWTLLLHCLLDKREFGRDRQETLRGLAYETPCDGPLSDVVSAYLPPGWDTERLVECARRGDWPALIELGPVIAKRWRRSRRSEVWTRFVGQRVARSSSRALRILQLRAPSVALLGPDGAGKSSLASALQERFYFPVRVVYAGLYPRGSLLARRTVPPGLGLITRFMRLSRKCLIARLHQMRGRLVIFDRFTYDALLPEARPAGRRSRIRRWLLARACRAPDVVVLLDTSTQNLLRRKAEQSGEVLEAQRRGYLKVAEALPGAVVVDATPEADEVRRTVTSLIWGAYRRRLTPGEFAERKGGGSPETL